MDPGWFVSVIRPLSVRLLLFACCYFIFTTYIIRFKLTWLSLLSYYKRFFDLAVFLRDVSTKYLLVPLVIFGYTLWRLFENVALYVINK